MAEIQQPDDKLNGVVAPTVPVVSSENVGSKRQRRPSVRLGEIGGDQTYDSHIRKPSSASAAVSSASKRWKHHPHLPFSRTKSSKNRSNNLDGVAIGSWRTNEFKKHRPDTKRVRSNWVPKFDDSGGGNLDINGDGETEEKLSGREDNEGFETEDSESPIRYSDNLDIKRNEREGLYRNSEDGVRIWLNSLGLGRYAPVFEIHEVDDEVLPLLTLEDLKDMGINAVGSRRQMYSAIQKLSKGFS